MLRFIAEIAVLCITAIIIMFIVDNIWKQYKNNQKYE